jgi:hypothetical protein
MHPYGAYEDEIEGQPEAMSSQKVRKPVVDPPYRRIWVT